MPRLPRPHARFERLRGLWLRPELRLSQAALGLRISPRSLTFPLRTERPRGERKPLEESPDTEEHGRWVTPPGETRGKVPQKHTADGAATREPRTGKGERVR